MSPTSSRENNRPARGFIGLANALLLVALAIGGYFAWAYGNMFVVKYAIEREARDLATRRLNAPKGSDPTEAVERFLAQVRLKANLELTRSDVVLTEQAGVVWVEVDTALPLEFFGRDEVTWRDTHIEVEVVRSKAY